MGLRKLETVIAYWTLGLMLVYIPVETYVSLPHGLLDPYYLIDAVAMILCLIGSIYSLRVRPRRAPELLCIAYAWTAANGWRATLARLDLLNEGETLVYGTSEMWVVGIGTALTLLFFAVLLVLVFQNLRSTESARNVEGAT